MKIAIITNPKSGNSEKFEHLMESINGKENITVHNTKRPEDIRAFARKAINEGFDMIVAAGGDGTINEVINGIAPDFDKIILGVIPLGTGNDLARTLDIPFDPLQALEIIETGKKIKIDLIKLESEGETHYCINVSSGGFSGEVNEVLSEDLKKTWGPLSYLIGAVTALPELTNYKTLIEFDDRTEELADVLNIIVANGKNVAGGYKVAVKADPQDGLLDVVVVHNGKALDLAKVAMNLASGNDYTHIENVSYYKTKSIKITSNPGMWFNIDGELLTKAPIKFTAIKQHVNIMVKNGFQLTD